MLEKEENLLKKIRKLHPMLRKAILRQAYKNVLKNHKVISFIKEKLNRMKTSPSKVVQAALKNKMNRKFIVRNLIKKYESSLLFAEIRLLLKNHQIRQLRRTQYKDRVKTIEKQGKMKKKLLQNYQIKLFKD